MLQEYVIGSNTDPPNWLKHVAKNQKYDKSGKLLSANIISDRGMVNHASTGDVAVNVDGHVFVMNHNDAKKFKVVKK